MMTNDDFMKSVMDELQNIKNNATQEEISKLNLYEFNPTISDGCIYGQLTGNCFSRRSRELMELGSVKSFSEDLDSFNNIKMSRPKIINSASSRAFTALEFYICHVPKNMHTSMFQFLKGEIETIELLKIDYKTVCTNEDDL